MSPDWGDISLPRSTMSEEHAKSKGRADSGYGVSQVDGSSMSDLVRESASYGEETATRDHEPHQTPQQKAFVEDALQQQKPASVKSSSSVPGSPNSRRDSAISGASSKHSHHSRRPKASRQASKQSLKSARDANANPLAIRQRPRRATTSPGGQSPQVANMEEALALHERSRQILGLGSGSTTLYGAAAAVAQPPPPGLYRSKTAASIPTKPEFDSHATLVEPEVVEDVEKPEEHYVPPPVTTYWTSTETRREEYAQIDKANKGMRGLLRKMFPKLTRGTSQSRFFNAEKDISDADSVRRYRLDLDDH